MITTWDLGYNKAKKKAKRIYLKLGKIRCPALGNKEISFSSYGFNHLIRKGRVLRPKNEQKRRFILLEYVEQIVKSPTTRLSYDERKIKRRINRHGQRLIIKSKAKFWTLEETINSCKIKVVIIQIENKNKRFCSIMGDDVKIKKPPKK